MVAMSEQTSTVQGRARATNVNLNMPARQAVQKINMPERSRGEIDVDPNKIVKGVVDGIEDYQEKKVEKGLNNYAREVNKIAEGVRQGAHSADAAEGKLRQLDDTYLAQGYKAEDLGTIRAKYDGGVYTARSAVLKEKEMHEAKRRLEVIDTFRKTYKFASNWADERCSLFIDNINRIHDELVATNKALESPNMSAEDRAAMTRVRNDQFERLGMENTMMQLNLRLENNQPLTAEEVAMFRQNFMAEARRNQIPLEVAAVMSDRMLDASGMSTIMELQKQNADNITEYNKKITGAMIESSRLGQYRSFPQLVTLDAMSAEARKAYLETEEGANLLRIIGTSLVGTYNNKTKTLELPATSTVPVLMNVVTNTTRQPSQYPATVLSNGISLTTDTLGQYNQENLINMSTPSDVKTAHYNAEAIQRKLFDNPNVIKVLETMSPEQQAQFEKSGRFNMAISEWTALMPDFVLDAKKMFNSLGTSRLRVNDEGLLVMSDDVTGSAKGFWQTTGNILGAFHSDIDEHIAGVNEFLSANLESPEERKEFIKMISGGHVIPNAGTFEVTEDNYRSVTGNIGDIVGSVAKGAWEADKAALNSYTNFNQKLGAAVNETINRITNNSVNSTVGELTGFGKESEKKPLIDMKKVTDVAGELFGFRDAGAAVAPTKEELESDINLFKTKDVDNPKGRYYAENLMKKLYPRSVEEIKKENQQMVPGVNGNIPLADRESIKLKDGTHATELSTTVEMDGKFYVIPTVYRDEQGLRVHSTDDAIEHFKKTGEFLHAEDDLKKAELMAFRIHDRERGGDVLAPYPNDEFKTAIVVASRAAGVPIEDIRGKTFAETSDGKRFTKGSYKGWFQVGDSAVKDVMADKKYIAEIKKIFPEFKGDKNNPIDNIFLGIGYMKKQEEEARRLFKKYGVSDETLHEYAFLRYTANQPALDKLLKEKKENWKEDINLINITDDKDNKYVNYLNNYRKAKEAAMKGKVVK